MDRYSHALKYPDPVRIRGKTKGASHRDKVLHIDSGSNSDPSRKRTRKQVDYTNLFKQTKREGFHNP